ncbi:hypothetical protein CEXT_668101 [Caerostris extrusa]|uniref:Uncharacterized protein n=1 Tax=Caerostris extrusa TaxID=172846 RepID=A0AAV4VWD8_CAEEX|nr:hypothetical protein CEXT_668101 [Caerostris extrusa]
MTPYIGEATPVLKCLLGTSYAKRPFFSDKSPLSPYLSHLTTDSFATSSTKTPLWQKAGKISLQTIFKNVLGQNTNESDSSIRPSDGHHYPIIVITPKKRHSSSWWIPSECHC